VRSSRRVIEIVKKMSNTTTPQERAEAASLRTFDGKGAATDEEGARALPRRVEIDYDAKQKYVLVQTKSTASYFVRGSENASYHKDAGRPLFEELRALSIPYEVLGGGRIEHSTNEATIKIYGFSYGFPWKDEISRHNITAQILKAEYPGYKVTFSDDGY